MLMEAASDVDIGRVVEMLQKTPGWPDIRNKLKMFDTVFVVDDSGSMSTEDIRTRDGGGVTRHSRWKILCDVLEVCSKVATENVTCHCTKIVYFYIITC